MRISKRAHPIVTIVSALLLTLIAFVVFSNSANSTVNASNATKNVNAVTDSDDLLQYESRARITSTYLLATLLDTSYPPPDIFFSGELNKPGAKGDVEREGKEEKKAEEKPPEKKKNVKAKTKR